MYIDVEPYILLFELYLKISGISLTNESFYTLCEFAKQDSSTYEISNTLKFTDFKTNYTNVYTKVKRFHALGLIAEIETNDLRNLHSAIYYRLTIAGIFCIFYNLREKSLLFQSREEYDITKGILNGYINDDEFFGLFVFPYFQKSTFLKLESGIVIEFLLNYFTEIAHSPPHIATTIIIHPDNNVNRTEKKKELVETFLHDMKILQSDIGLEPFKNSLLMDLAKVQFDILEKHIIFPIISVGKYWSTEVQKYDSEKFKQSKFKPFDVRYWQNIRTDIGLLINDEKFYANLNNLKSSLDKCYNNIIKLRQRVSS